MKFLIVDDSAAILTIIKRSLQRHGFADSHFLTATDAANALVQIESGLPDVVITDWHMPGMSGLELLHVIRQSFQEPPIVGFVTTESTPERLAEARLNGAAFIIGKPFSERQLADAVNESIAERNAAQTAEQYRHQPEINGGARYLICLGADEVAHRFFKRIHCEVQVTEIAHCDIAALPKPWTASFYGLGGRKDIRGLCVMDHPAMLMLGWMLLGMDRDIRKDTAELPPILMEKLEAALEQSGDGLYAVPSGESFAMIRCQKINAVNPKFVEIIEKKDGRRIFHLTGAGFPTGTLIVIAR